MTLPTKNARISLRPGAIRAYIKNATDPSMLTIERKKEIIETHATAQGDTGSPQVQVALLTAQINELTEHMRANKHDFSSRRGLLAKVSRRTRLLKYLMKTDRNAYQELIKKLGLRR